MKGRARSQLTGQEGAVAILMAILLVVLLAAVHRPPSDDCTWIVFLRLVGM